MSRMRFQSHIYRRVLSVVFVVFVVLVVMSDSHGQGPDAPIKPSGHWIIHDMNQQFDIGWKSALRAVGTGDRFSLTYPEFNPDSNKVMHDSVMSIVLRSFAGNDTGLSLEQLFDKRADARRSSCRSEARELSGLSLGSYEETEIRVLTDTNGVVGLDVSWTSAGGAHPVSTGTYINLRADNGSHLSLDDLLLPGYKPTIDSIAEIEFREIHQMSTSGPMSGGWNFKGNKFSLNDNFLISDKGLKFCFNDYEVSPYAQPAGCVLLTYESLKPIIRPDGPLAPWTRTK